LAWLLLALSTGICVVWFIHALGYWEDDAWIHLEFARSLAAGHGFSFNGHLVYGDTSPLWVFLLVAFHMVIPGWMAAGKTLTVVAAIFAVAGVFFFSRGLARETLAPADADIFAATMVLVFVANPYFDFWAFSGMEAVAAAGLVCWGMLATLRTPITPARFLAGALAAGLAPVLRPEMGFFTVLLGLVLLQRWFTMPARRWGLLLSGLVLSAAPAVAWASYAVHTFGRVVPNTNAAKRAAPHASVVLRLLQVYSLGFPVVLLGLLLLAVWLLWYLLRGRRGGAVLSARVLPAAGWLLFVWTAIDCVFYTVDHTYVQTRYIFVTAPALTLVMLAITVQYWPAIYRALVAVTVIFSVVLGGLSTWPLIRGKVENIRVKAELVEFLRTLPPDAPIALYSIGEVGFLSEHPLIDTGGITRPGIIPLFYDATEDRRTAWIYSQGGKYEVIDHSPGPGATLVWSHEIPSESWSLRVHAKHDPDRLMVWKLPNP
jgi:hypothetical protein